MKRNTDASWYDAIVIGSGFAGAVTACRLAEARFRVCLLERGRRYEKDDFPTYPSDALVGDGDVGVADSPIPDFSRWLWSQDHGLFDIRDLDHVVSVQAAGYGGGSLIYANVHLRPPAELFNRGWPEQYQGGALRSYFDLAAWMLRVRTIPDDLAKTLQLKRAAGQLNGQHFFKTPLAVNFDVNGANAFQREQHPCDNRGRCCIGCDRQAKNTLDMNYLARAEDAGARVITLANVTKIEKVDGQDGPFIVTYEDVLLRTRDGEREERSVKSRWLFLCAGAVNTTELLLRNGKSLKLSDDVVKVAGSHYFPNSDSLAAVFDCDERHEADFGPTITGAIVTEEQADGELSWVLDFKDGKRLDQTKSIHAGAEVRLTDDEMKRTGKDLRAVLAYEPLEDWGSWDQGDVVGTLVLVRAEGQEAPPAFEPDQELIIPGYATARVRSRVVVHTHWFLAQDGGYPSDVQPLAGIFRSPLWLRRNRFNESAPSSRANSALRRPAGAELRLGALAEALRGTAARAASREGLLDRTFSASTPSLATSPLGGFVPSWFADALADERNGLLDRAGSLALPLVGKLLDALAEKVGKQLDPETLASFALGIGGNAASTVKSDDGRKVMLIRGLLREALQILGGGESELAGAAVKVLLGPVPATPEGLVKILGQVVLWALAYGEPDEHTGIILTMGRDLYRGRLYLKAGTGEPSVLARLPGRILDTSAALQERMLRAIAKDVWKGELRANPAWATFDRRLTVHSQGGCPMGEPRMSVTDHLGQVHGCPGLYVMDAAAFPTSVGVNPSATILAIAEYKIHQFVIAHGRVPDAFDAECQKATAWVRSHGDIDPLNSPRPDVAAKPQAPLPAPLGLEFSERMEGFFSPCQNGPRVREELCGSVPQPFKDAVQQYRGAEDTGSRAGSRITVELKAVIKDLARLVASDDRVLPLAIPLRGSVTIEVTIDGRLCDPEVYDVKADSVLRMFVPPQPPLPQYTRFFRYDLILDDGFGQRGELHGVKVLRNDPGMDMWLDTATLYFDMLRGGQCERGILRLSLNDFLMKQLRSMDVTGTSDPSDPSRRSWALLAFWKYFGSELSRIYAERLKPLMQVFLKALTSVNV